MARLGSRGLSLRRDAAANADEPDDAPVIVVAISGIALASGIYAASRRNVVNALNVNDVPPTTANIAA
jgi:hypothetical protein